MKNEIPEIDNEFLCIANSKEPVLTAITLSYLSKKGKYLPLFQFKNVTIAKSETESEEIDEHHISRTNGHELDVKINNVLYQIGGCKYLILVGLTEQQKSYLSFLKKYTVIDIMNIEDAKFLLQDLTNKCDFISCKSDDIHYALFKAIKSGSIINIDEDSESLKETCTESKGLIVIEDIKSTSTIIAVNYACAVGANIKMITPPEISRTEIKQLVENWQEGNHNSYLDLSAKIYNSVELIDFKKYNYATFFTEGIPYSLILKNTIPFTHVHLNLNPDLFIFNNLWFENNYKLYSAIVFSPIEFNYEETEYVIKITKESNYYVKELIGKDATVYNIDMHVKEFPFSILHICSHGGEVEGYAINEEFIDRNGDKHTIEYDEVVSFAPTVGEELISVTTKMIWKKFDGMIWESKEFREAKFPNYIFSDMINRLRENKEKKRVKRNVISNSCGIKCIDFYYQGMFNLLAGSYSPLIFNNTCWSGYDMSHHFIGVGARGYIGTLWNVSNGVAKNTAESFYEKLFDNTVLDSLQNAIVKTIGTKDENIYIFWGLHFTSFDKGVSIADSKVRLASALLHSLSVWRRKLETQISESTKENVQRIIKWNASQIAKYFRSEAIEIFKKNEK